VFSLGLDARSVSPEEWRELIETPAESVRHRHWALYGVEAVASLSKPVIAALNGDALGAGLEVALACDIRVSREDAASAFRKCERMIPMSGGTQRLPRIIGLAKALELIMTGNRSMPMKPARSASSAVWCCRMSSRKSRKNWRHRFSKAHH
jgi:enoyl-CoA hydratase/carnithine racemase